MTNHQTDAGTAVSLGPEQRYDHGQVASSRNHKHNAIGGHKWYTSLGEC